MRTHRSGRVLVNGLCLLVIAFCLAWLLPSVLGFERYVITGGSMSGTFDKGSVAFEKLKPVDALEVGDVITYRPPADSGTTSLVTHRITRITDGAEGRRVFRTKGDANADVDPWRFSLSSTDQPVVSFTVPKAGYVFIALANRTVRTSLIGGPALLIVVLSLAEAGRNLRRSPAGADPARTADHHRTPVAVAG